MANYNHGVAYADVIIPALVLESPDCPSEVVDAVAALGAANDATADAEDKVFEAKQATVAAEAAIRAAVESGKATPKGIEDERVLRARVEHAEKVVREKEAEAYAAAQAVDAAAHAHRPELRAILAAALPDAHAKASAAIAAAQAADGYQRDLVAALVKLDESTAQAFPPRVRRYAIGAVLGAYANATKQDPSLLRSAQVPMAWSDVVNAVNGLPVDAIAAADALADADVVEQMMRAEQAADRTRRIQEERA
ncbi:hypothetical protein [Streptomyces sp. JNUCC 63]